MIWHYVSTALRGFAGRPVNTAIKLLALSLGLACLLTAHAVGDYFHRADRDWAKADRIYAVVQETDVAGGGAEAGLLTSAAPLAETLRLDFPELEAVARMSTTPLLVRRQGRSAVMRVRGADPDLLDVFDLEMLAGEAALDRPRTVLLDNRAAAAMFGAEDPIGQTVTLDLGVARAQPFDATVVGVYREIPEASHMGASSESPMHGLVSLATWDQIYSALFPVPPLSEAQTFANKNYVTYAVLPENGALTAASLNRRLEDFAERRVSARTPVRFRAAPVTAIKRDQFNRQAGLPFGVSLTLALYLLGALTLATGCINYANLAAAEAAARAREIGMRKTVGASRSQVAVQILVECAILGAVALAISLPLVRLAVDLIGARFAIPVALPGAGQWGYWGPALAALCAVALAAGAYPAWLIAKLRPAAAVRSKRLQTGSRAVRTVLTGAQFSAAALLIIMVLVMVGQQAAQWRAIVPPGGAPIVSAVLGPGEPTASAQAARLESVRRQLLDHPAVEAVTFRQTSAFAGAQGQVTEFARSFDPAAPSAPAQFRSIYYDYFDATGVRMLAGREFSRDRDDRYSVIIDAATARRMSLTPEQAVGQPIYQAAARGQAVDVRSTAHYEYRIIGVAEREPLEIAPPGPNNFLYSLRPHVAGAAIVRLSGSDADAGIAHIAEVWSRMGRAPHTTFLQAHLRQTQRAYTAIILVFIGLSVTAIAISAMGLFGLTNFIVQQRLHEIGVRKSVGASARRIFTLMIRDFLKPVLLANLLVWPVAWLAARAYLDLFLVSGGLSPAPFLASLGITLAAATAVVAAHVIRASRLSPARVLRAE